MRILIAEDDFSSRKFMLKFLSRYGQCDVAVDGLEALDLVLSSIKEKDPYQLICLDIMMPKLDGIKVLKSLRDIEKLNGISDEKKSKVIMTTALNETKTVIESYDSGCEAYAQKPIDIVKFVEVMRNFKLVE